MSESPEEWSPEDALQKRSDWERYGPYVKLGLMGLGGLFVLKLGIALLTNPIVLVAGLAAGGAAWWYKKQTSTPSGPIVPPAPSASSTVSSQGPPRTSPGPTPPGPPPSAPRSRAPAAPLASGLDDAPDGGAPEAPVGGLDEMEARLQRLEALKRKMEEQGDL